MEDKDGIRPFVRVVPFAPDTQRGRGDKIEDILSEGIDDYTIAYEELFHKEEEDNDDGWWGFALALAFACITVHLWSHFCLAYLAWYPTLAVLSLVLLVFLSGWLYHFLEGQDDDDEIPTLAKEMKKLKNLDGSKNTLVRAATALCASFPCFEEDELMDSQTVCDSTCSLDSFDSDEEVLVHQ